VKIEEVRARWRAEILRAAEEFGARNIRLFGSIARGEAESKSDLDLLVEMEPGRSYLDLIGFWQALQDRLGCHVDVITDGGINPHLKDSIYKDAVPL
jgi:predicted nucleotidyltransferase